MAEDMPLVNATTVETLGGPRLKPLSVYSIYVVFFQVTSVFGVSISKYRDIGLVFWYTDPPLTKTLRSETL